jgi:hypothetical protein
VLIIAEAHRPFQLSKLRNMEKINVIGRINRKQLIAANFRWSAGDQQNRRTYLSGELLILVELNDDTGFAVRSDGALEL